MRQGADEIILTKEEYMILAALAGVRTLFGTFPEEGEDFENDMLQGLFALTKDDMIKITSDGAELDEELRRVFSVIRDSRCILTAYAGMPQRPPISFYLTEAAVACVKEGSFDGDRLHVGTLEESQVWDAIEEGFGLPQGGIPTELMQEQDREEKMQIEFRPVGDLIRTEKLLLLLDLLDVRQQRTRMRLLVVEEDLYPELVLQTENRQETCGYSPKRAKEWARRILMAGMTGFAETEDPEESDSE